MVHPLIKASNAGYIVDVDRQIRDGADINILNAHGETPLDRAVSAGHTGIVALLLAKGAKSGKKNGIDGLLHSAAFAGFSDISALLIHYGANIHSREDNGISVLHQAVHEVWATLTRGHRYVIQLLITHGIDINVRDAEGRTPLSWVLDGKDRENAIKLIKDLGGVI